MKRVKNASLMMFSALCILLLTAAIPASKPEPIKPESLQNAVAALKVASADGNISYKELKAIATEAKGSKLTLKERIGLKVFGKKITSKTVAPFEGGAAKGKSQLIALILCFFLGCLGIHRFYLGYTWQGVVQLLTLGGCGVWALIDFIRIIIGDLQPKTEAYETTL
ncbi:MAG TPA: TM2 domain-containing protein [Pseudobacter sp.]|nr:TM2 domain-containing protein [Pseudobacter sp.]